MNLKTSYLGLELNSPIVASCSPLTSKPSAAQRMVEAGVGAIIMPSLFEEQVRHEQDAMDHLLAWGAECSPEAAGYFPPVSAYRVGPDRYIDELAAAARSLPVPVIGSLNGVSAGGWTSYARSMEAAGVAAIELNVYYLPTDPEMSGVEVEQRYLDVLSAVRDAVTIPVTMKLSPYFSSLAHLATRLAAGGANGLSLFNRFYQPDIDLESQEVAPTLELSRPADLRLTLLWTAVLRGRLGGVSIAAGGGVRSGEDVAKLILAGADVATTTAALLEHGPGYVGMLLDGLRRFMAEHGYPDLAAFRGRLSKANVANPSAFERANYLKVLQAYRSPWL